MVKLLTALGTALASILGDRIITAVEKMLSGSVSLNATEQASLDRTVASQALAAAFYARFGLPGVASAYDAGLISVVEFAAYVVKGEAYRITPANQGRVQDLEDKAKGTSLFSSSFSDLSEVTTDPDGVARMYGYLLASQSNR